MTGGAAARLRWVLATLVGVGALALAAPAVAQTQRPGAGDAGATDSVKEYWQGRYRELLLGQRRAHQRLERAEGVWTRGQRNGELRGDPRVEARKELEAARAAARAADRALEEFPDRARRAGVLPGWLREVEEELGPPAPAALP